MYDSDNGTNPSKFGHQDSFGSGSKPRKLWILRFLTFILPVLVIIGAVVGMSVMSQFKPKPEEKEEIIKALPVLTAAAYRDDITLKVNVQGEVQPRTQINVVPQVSGKITYMSPKFIEGGKFSKGDLLIRVEPTEFELRAVQAQANVAQAETVITRERTEAEIARKDWEELGRAGSPTALTLREPQLAEAQAQLASAKARLSEAELMLSRTTLHAPFTGRVISRHVDQGEFVTAGSKLGEIYAIDIMDVRLPMTNNELRKAGLTLGFEANADTPAIPVTLSANVAGSHNEWRGKIVRTDNQFDSQTRVLFAYAEVTEPFKLSANNNAPLAPGIFVTAAIDGNSLEDTLIIPRAALRGQDTVYVANSDETLSIKTVSVLSSDRDIAVIGGGLNEYDDVITSPIRGVADGMKIAKVSSGTSDTAQTSEEVTP